MSVRIYTYDKCDTCRRALRFLDEAGVEFEKRAIRETPPTVAELRVALAEYSGNVRRLFNVSGREYRALGVSEKLGSMSADEALELLANNGQLVKRPFVVGDGVVLVGFDCEVWRQAFQNG